MKRTMLTLALLAAGAIGAQAQVSERQDYDDPRAEDSLALRDRGLSADPRDLGPGARDLDESSDQAEATDSTELRARIAEAVREGRLTRSEAQDLREDLAQLREYEERARDQELTRREREHMEEMRIELSRRIDQPESDGSRYGYRAAPDAPRSYRRY